MKAVSVVVATYKREEALKNALESLARQSYSNMEIVLVDDNANLEWNQKVSKIVDAFRDSFPDVSLNFIVNKSNQGSAKTRNIGIEAAKGEYITFLDDDDIYLPDKIKNQAEFMENGQYDYSITDLVLYNENGKEIDKRVRSYIEDTSKSALKIYHFKYHMTGTDTMMFRKEYLVQIGGFAPIDVGDEFYLMQRAIDGDGKFGYFPGCDIKAYVHTGEGGLSSGAGKIKGENDLYEYKKTHFNQLKSRDVRYIKMRHHAVIAFAYLRNGKKIRFLAEGIMALLSAPVQGMQMMLQIFQGNNR